MLCVNGVEGIARAEGGANLNVASELAVIVGRPIVHVNGSMLTQENYCRRLSSSIGTSAMRAFSLLTVCRK